MAYQKINQEILRKLKLIVGKKNIITNQDGLEPYSHDEVLEFKSFPEVVVKASSSSEVSQVLALANQELIPVTPRGGGTGLSGGAVPLYGGIILSLEKMNKILEIDPDNLMAIVEPGVITGELQRAVEEWELFYPVDPASLDSCTIGGNIAECAGGPRALKYGVTKDYVCGLEVVLPTSEIVKLGGKVVKNVTGYDLINLIIGSEGTLGIITQVILKLLPLPKVRMVLLALFDSIEIASKCVNKIICEERVIPSSVEFLEREGILACQRFLEKKFPYPEADAYLFIELDGNNRETTLADLEATGEICFKSGAIDVFIAESQLDQERLWEARRMIPEALKAESPIIIKEDVVVPRQELPNLIKGIKEIRERYNLTIVNFGHVGDGNVHINILRKDMSEKKWKDIHSQVLSEIFKLTISLGGTISGEHGIGLYKKKFLPMALSESEIKLIKKIKRVFDPKNILNPGKIID